MKKYFLFGLLAMIGSSCSDFLTLTPENQIDEVSFYKNINDFNAALTGNYASLQTLHNPSIVYIGDLTTDNAEVIYSLPLLAEVEFDEISPTSANTSLGTIWTSCFTIISRSNNILDRLPAANLNEQQKNKLKGESLFLRAFSYFYLVRIFGEIPIVETAFRSPKEVQGFDMRRRPIADVYALIEQDLNESATLLQGEDSSDKSRASSGAAKTLLGKVHLTNGKFQESATVLKQVIDENRYTLYPDYGALFSTGNDNLPESIFEILYMSGNVGEGNSFSTLFTPGRFDMAIFPGNMQGMGRVLPTQDIWEAYEDGDKRKSASVGDSILLNTGKYEKERYGKKFVDFSTGIAGDGGVNFTSLRFADVLLMYAEALNELNDTEGALASLNRVRNRAGLDGLSALSQTEIRLALERERRVEFLHEGHRWFDLVRTGRAQAVINEYFTKKGLEFSVEDHELLMPIPLREININPNLGQNEGY